MAEPLLEVEGLVKRFGGFTALNRVSLSVKPGRALRSHRTQRLGQDDADQLRLRRPARRRRLDSLRGPRHHHAAAAPADAAGHRAQLPDPQALHQHDRAGEPGDPARVRGGRTRAATRDAEAAEILRDIGLDAKAHLRPAGLTQIEMRKLELARAMAARPEAPDLRRGHGRALQHRGGRHPGHPVPAQHAGHHHHHDRAHHAGGDALLRAHRGPRRRRAHRRGHAGRRSCATPPWRRPTLASRILVRATWTPATARCACCTACPSRSARARPSRCSAPTATARARSSSASWAWSGRRPARVVPRDRTASGSTSPARSTEEIVRPGHRAGARGPRACSQADGGGEPAARRLPARRAAPTSRATWPSAFEAFPVLRRRRRQLAGSMSGGEQQMLAIGARAHVLAAHPAGRRAVGGAGARSS